MSIWLRVLVAGVIAASSGCHRVFPYEAFERQDGGVVSRDAGQVTDGPGVDRRVEPTSDALATTDVAALCTENQPLATPTCSGCGKASCDDLPDYRDPWSDLGCKAVLLSEDFCGDLRQWKASPPSPVTIAPRGVLRFGGTGTTAISATITGVASVPMPGYLVELRLQTPAAARGSIQLWADVRSGQRFDPSLYRSCELRWTASGAELRNLVSTPSFTDSGETPATVPAGQSVVLQSYIRQSEHHCRLASETTILVDRGLPIEGPIPAGEPTITIAVVPAPGAALTVPLDWVRIFHPASNPP
ncbi:MAG: hypothetical protein IT371_00415 [Deltaproteobacteria bacterium]|nr:hypothetical protein [Deltaproteobacteria bacterium]